MESPLCLLYPSPLPCDSSFPYFPRSIYLYFLLSPISLRLSLYICPSHLGLSLAQFFLVTPQSNLNPIVSTCRMFRYTVAENIKIWPDIGRGYPNGIFPTNLTASEAEVANGRVAHVTPWSVKMLGMRGWACPCTIGPRRRRHITSHRIALYRILTHYITSHRYTPFSAHCLDSLPKLSYICRHGLNVYTRSDLYGVDINRDQGKYLPAAVIYR